MKTPVLIIAFNRPDPLALLLRRLREVGAENLYFAVDGPRTTRPEDRVRVEAVKSVIHENFAPPPDHCLFQPENLGIRRGPPAAISWFFEQVEEGIILEDDCIPHPDFFPFVDWALKAYRHEDRVMVVSGFNRFSPQPWSESSRWIKTAMIWGWATWRRAWALYDGDMSSWDDPVGRRKFRRWAGAFPVYDHWAVAIEWVRTGRLITWDIAWCWAVFQRQGLCLMPRVSLIQNVGFGDDSTNTLVGDERARVKAGALPPPYLAPKTYRADLGFQRKLDRKEFWRTDGTLVGRVFGFLRVLKRKYFARQS